MPFLTLSKIGTLPVDYVLLIKAMQFSDHQYPAVILASTSVLDVGRFCAYLPMKKASVIATP